MIEGILEELGVEITRATSDEIQGYCPVHHLVEGQAQSKPKWYINAETGAWICFTCGQKGSLPMLVEALGGDKETIEHLKLTSSLTTTTRWSQNEDGEDVPERIIIDPVIFDANPYPPVRVMDAKDVSPDVVAQYNARWDAKGKCWMLPIYSFDNQLLGWQEKAKGYFMNVPRSVKKSESLFGWHTFRAGQLIVVESPLDAMRFASYGYKSVATYGSFVSEEQVNHISMAEEIVLAFDNDDAGDHAMDQMTRALILDWGHPGVSQFSYPRRSRGADPGELPPRALMSGVETARLPRPTTKENKDGYRPPARRTAQVYNRKLV